MKRLQLLAAMLLCSLLTFAQFSGSGSGTENDPYLILNPIQLNQMRNFLNQSGVYFKLMADIDLTDFIEDEYPNGGWLPIGNSSSAFCGVLDGNGKTISGLKIDRQNTDDVGFFGYTKGCSIKNLLLKVNIIGNNNVGGFIGHAGCLSENNYVNSVDGCSIEGIIHGVENVAGFIGLVTDKVTYSYYDSYKGRWLSATRYTNIHASNLQAQVSIISSGSNNGSIIGYLQEGSGEALNCKSSMSVISGIDYIGGIIGRGNCTLNKCAFMGGVSGQSYVGGICGSQESNMSECFVVSSISATGDCIGGIVGISENSTSITDCYFSGSVYGRNQVGGLVGFSNNGWNNNKISHCQSIAVVKGNDQIGGLVGCLAGDIESSISHCELITALSGNIGRIYGFKNSGNVGTMGTSNENKAYNKAIVIKAGVAQEITDNEQNGTGVSKTTLKLKATYVAMGWDFTNTWDIQETECYPYMKTQTAPPVIQSQLISGTTTISGKCVDGGIVTLEIDGAKQQMASTSNEFSFTVSPLQAGHEVRLSAKADSKEQSYYTTEVVSYLGNGTEADPYQVYTASDLTGVYRKGYFKLMNDIDLTSYINQFSPMEGWESIGREGSETIHFDGDGHKITGLWCNSTRGNTGLFSCFANGTIKNLTVETAAGKQVKGGSNTGILIGKMMSGTIEDCYVSGSVADGTPVGGMVGLFDDGTIIRCQANVTISTTLATSYVGGLVGEITGGTIDQCVTNGTLTGTGSESYVGGLVGKNSATLTNCYSIANVTSSYNAAGLVAYNYGIVEKSYSMGNLFSNNYAAGVIGYNDGANAIVRNCSAVNNKIEVVYESQQTQQGGGYGQRIIGGIKNSAPAPEMNNYALSTMQVSVNDVPQRVYDDIMNGVAKTEAELKTASTYQGLGWDFTDVWSIEEGANYPKLSWESTTPIPSDVVTGDANGDNTVNVTDYLTIANYILGLNVENFNETAADVNEDNDVNVSDYVGVANIILYGNYTGSSANSIKARTAEGSSAWMEVCEAEDGNLNLLLHNAKTFSAFQMDINLPEGLGIAEATMAKGSQTRNLGIARLNDGTYRLLYGTLENKAISLVDDGLLTIVLKRNNRVNGVVYIDNIILTHKDASSVRLSGVQTPMVTGIDMVDSETKAGVYYDLSGRRVAVRPLKKGMYIVNGEKMLVK